MAAAVVMQRAKSRPSDLRVYRQAAVQDNFEKEPMAGKFEKAKEWLSQGAVTYPDRIHTLIDVAARENVHLDLKAGIINFLLEQGNPINLSDSCSRTALHHPARLGRAHNHLTDSFLASEFGDS